MGLSFSIFFVGLVIKRNQPSPVPGPQDPSLAELWEVAGVVDQLLHMGGDTQVAAAAQ